MERFSDATDLAPTLLLMSHRRWGVLNALNQMIDQIRAVLLDFRKTQQLSKKKVMVDEISDQITPRRAKRFIRLGLEAVVHGYFRRARSHFKASAELHPTADAYTYWAWMEHQLGRTHLAIQLCRKAIKFDPNFGNPYNDIGSYLISLGRVEESIEWFEKATQAERYEPRQFPHLNLARVFLSKKKYFRALKEFKAALKFDPENTEIKYAIAAIQKTIRQETPDHSSVLHSLSS